MGGRCACCVGGGIHMDFGGAHGVGTDAGRQADDTGVAATSAAGVSGAHDECGMCMVEDDNDLDGARDGGEGTSGAVDGGAAQSMNEQMSDVIDGGAPMSVDEQVGDAGTSGGSGGALRGAIVKKKKNKGGIDKRRRQAQAKAAAAVSGGARR